MFSRITREHMYMEMARLIAQRSTCPRAQVGCVLVQGRRMIGMGYNGSPPGLPHCYEVGCEEVWTCDAEAHDTGRGRYEFGGCSRAIHAEANAISFAARSGVGTEFSMLWTTHAPCTKCAQLIVAAGIVGVHYNHEYRDSAGIQLLKAMKVTVMAQSD